MSEESTVGAQYETVQDKQDPENFVQEDKDDGLCPSKGRTAAPPPCVIKNT